MKHTFAIVTLFTFAVCFLHLGCTGGGEHDHSSEHGHGHDADPDDLRPGIVFTRWDAHTELFVEFPAFVVGEESRFAAHITRLSDFSALQEGHVRVALDGDGDGDGDGAEVDEPSRPGIFMPSLTPTRAGAFRLTLHYKLEDGVEGTYDLGEATVYADVAAAEASASPAEDGGGTVFLKEQQWQIPFATEAAALRPLRPSIEAYATLRARPDGEVELPAPVAGRLAAGEVPFPRLGARVDRDQALAAIVPQLGQDDDRVTLELAVKRAQIDLENARIERERLEGLFKAGAVPERRVIEARHNEREVMALKSATNRRRRNFGRVQRTDQGEGDIAVRSPLTGTIIEVNAAPGEFVVAGKTLFVTADLERLWLEVHVPEREALRLGEPSGVWFATPGHNKEEGVDEAIVEVGAEAFVAVGGRIDPKSRTLPIHYEVANPGGRFPLGVYVVAHLLTGSARDALAVPRTAVTHEGPMPVVYVQTGGELFERRPVELGTRDGDWVEIRHGIVEGERVVTRSAYAIRLAGAAGAVPAHGHAH